jgi:hypothetical protein
MNASPTKLGQRVHAREAKFLKHTGDAVDALLAAKDAAKLCGYPCEQELSNLVETIHQLQNKHVPGFGP